MSRILAIAACAFALTLAVPVAFDAGAEAKSKTCRAKIGGKTTTWKCEADQKCCVDTMSGKGTCSLLPMIGCL